MASCTFKPKGMSYTEFLRSKKATDVKVIDTKPVRDASDITTSRRLGASRVFALNNEHTKGVISNPIDFSLEPSHKTVSGYKAGGGSRKVGSASDFTAYLGGQAIDNEVKAGLPPARLTQTPAFKLTSPAVSQSSSDFVRKAQGCKDALGEQHDASTVTPAKFVDDTIRNLGDPSLCTTRAANHSVKTEIAFGKIPNRPSQAGGQLAIFGNLEPGKEAGAYGGVTIAHVKSNIPVASIRTRSGVNPHYKAGAAMDNIPYVEKHHGNDLHVNPKQPFVKYQIPGGVTPAHLKINKPISTLCCPTGYPGPATLLLQIANLTGPNTYTLKDTTVILENQKLIIPLGITLKIPPGFLLTNNGTILCDGTINNDAIENNATFTILPTGTFINTVSFINNAGATFTSSGIIANSGTFTGNLGNTFTNTGTITNTGTFVINEDMSKYAQFDPSYLKYNITSNVTIQPYSNIVNIYDIIVNAGVTLTNNGTFNNAPYFIIIDGRFVNTSYGNLTLDNELFIHSPSGTLTNSGTITNNSFIENNGSFTNTAGSTLINNGLIGGTGSVINDLSFYATLAGTVYTLNGDQIIPTNTGTKVPAGYTLVIPSSATLTNRGTITNNGLITNNGAVTNESTSAVTNSGTIANSGTFTGYLGITFTDTGAITNTGMFVIYEDISKYAVYNPNTDEYDITSNVTIPRYRNISSVRTVNVNVGATLTNNGTIDNAQFYIQINGTFVNTIYGNLLFGNGVFVNAPSGALTNYGSVACNAFIDNHATITNNTGSTFTNTTLVNNNAGSTFTNRGTLTNSSTFYNYAGSTVTNSGTIINSGTFTGEFGCTFTDTGTITNTGTFEVYEDMSKYAIVDGNGKYTITSNLTIPIYRRIIITHDLVVNAGVIFTNNSTFEYNSSVFTIKGTFVNTSYGNLTVYNGLYIDSLSATLTNAGTITNNSTSTIDISGTITSVVGATINNTGTIIKRLGSTFTNNGTFNNTGTIISYVPLSTYATLVGSVYTLNGNQTLPVNTCVTVPLNYTLVILSSNTFNISGYLTNDGTIDISGTITSVVGATINNTGTIIKRLGSTFTNNGTLNNTGTILTYVPLSTYATLVGSVYTLNGNQTLPVNTCVTVPLNYTLVILSSNTFNISGYLTNNGATNINGSINSAGFGSYKAPVINNGTITISGSGSQLYNDNSSTVTNNGTIHITNTSAWFPSAPSVNTVTGTVIVDAFCTLYIQNAPFTNHGTITNNGTMNLNENLINDGTITNTATSNFKQHGIRTVYNYGGGVINTSGTITEAGPVNNANGSGACGAGTLGGTNPLIATGSACPPS